MVQDSGLEPLASAFVEPRSSPDELILQTGVAGASRTPIIPVTVILFRRQVRYSDVNNPGVPEEI